MNRKPVKKQWGRTLRVSEEMYRRLDALRLTDKGKVAFEDVLKWLLQEKKRFSNGGARSSSQRR